VNIDLPVPTVTPEAEPYWRAAREGQLVLQRCAACGIVRFYPRFACPACWSERAEWIEASGQGRVHTFTIVHRAPSAAFAGRVPYVVALVDLAEGPRMTANIVGDGALDVQIDDPVTVTFEERADGFKLPQFTRSAR
jgi:uncharacterized protein